MVGSCEQRNESLVFTKDTEFLIKLSNKQILKADSVAKVAFINIEYQIHELKYDFPN